jgi:toxin FitB
VRERTDPVVAAALGRWLDGLRQLFADRILAVDDAVAIAWGHLMTRRNFPVPDGLIAATARVHNLTLATRNTADFADAGVDVVNPWAASGAPRS